MKTKPMIKMIIKILKIKLEFQGQTFLFQYYLFPFFFPENFISKKSQGFKI